LRNGCFCLAMVNTSQVENAAGATMNGQAKTTMTRKVGMAALMLVKPLRATIEIKAKIAPVPKVISSEIMNATIQSAII